MTEADLIRWVGVIAGLFGAIIAAPTGAMLILLDVWALILGAWTAVQRIWNRFIRRKTEPAPATYALAGSAAAHSTAEGALALRHHGASLDVQVRQLWDEVARLDGRLNQAETANRNRHEVVMASIEQESADRRAALEALDARRRRDQRRAARPEDLAVAGAALSRICNAV